MDPGDCPDSGGRPEEAADSEMTTDLVLEDGQKVGAWGSVEGRGNFSSGSVDFDGEGVVAVKESVAVRSGKFSEPYFLQRVLKEELGGGGGGGGGGHRLLVVAVHAVMQESGFVAVDPVTGTSAGRYHLPDQCPSTLWYRASLNVPECVLLKFQSLGHFIIVYGSLPKAKLGLRRLCLDGRRFAPAIDLMWAKGKDNDVEEEGNFSASYPVKEVFEFWKSVKDDLALPLLMDLTERAGLPLPSCFPSLLTELKLKIFESLSGIDLARVGCVCSELRSLTSDNDLWKQKCVDEFKKKTESGGMINWKQSFARLWEAKKETKKKRRRRVVGPDAFAYDA
ncbi:hypothetical protein BT93_L3252 [Corymbia citriodora subsp. variegata]|uniref:F-box domain-containing protein n=1 Tax=Corymbia citriodora subsp. variegata TaxID=360336 RepID=A0A8T0CHN9_CORYI|nr:hypothetical protein BT93_L3252 [Corymbia citriodora subsp. variegata]